MDLLGLDPLQTKVIPKWLLVSNHNSATISIWKANRERGESTEEVHLGQRFDKGNQKEFDIDWSFMKRRGINDIYVYWILMKRREKGYLMIEKNWIKSWRKVRQK